MMRLFREKKLMMWYPQRARSPKLLVLIGMKTFRCRGVGNSTYELFIGKIGLKEKEFDGRVFWKF